MLHLLHSYYLSSKNFIINWKKNSAGRSASVALPTIQQKRFYLTIFPVEINYARVKIGPMFFASESEQNNLGFSHTQKIKVPLNNSYKKRVSYNENEIL